MDVKVKLLIYFIISVGLLQSTDSAVIQALIDFDDNSEDLIGSLISRVDHIVDPVKDDMTNISLSLAYALLKLAPTLSITGNVSDGANTITLTFSFSATTADTMHYGKHHISHLHPYHHSVPPHSPTMDEDAHLWSGRGGFFEPVIVVVEPWVLFVLEIAAHSILGVIVTQILQATTLLENVPLT